MADSFLDNAGGFTPVPDKLVREYDFTTAYVWGKVWRYCQMQSGACTASHETIAKRAGMSRRTLIEKLNILIQDGYIEDLTPNLKNKPHTYCTKKGEAKITSTMQISHTESDILMETPNPDASESHLGMRNLHNDNADNAQSDNPTMQNLHSESAKGAQSAKTTMQNLHLKKQESPNPESNPTKESKRETPAPIPKKQREITIPAFKVFVEITEYHAINAHWRSEMARIVGDKPDDLEFWRRVIIGWTGKYPSKHNVEGMLDFYKRREIPGYRQSPNGIHKEKEVPLDPTSAALTAALQSRARPYKPREG